MGVVRTPLLEVSSSDAFPALLEGRGTRLGGTGPSMRKGL